MHLLIPALSIEEEPIFKRRPKIIFTFYIFRVGIKSFVSFIIVWQGFYKLLPDLVFVIIHLPRFVLMSCADLNALKNCKLWLRGLGMMGMTEVYVIDLNFKVPNVHCFGDQF